MNHYSLSTASLKGHINTPPSKSQTLRAILFASLALGQSTIINFLDSPDSHAMIRACQLFGATINVFPNRLEIIGTNGQISCAKDVIDAGNSGIVLRFCSAIGSLSPLPIVITGDQSIRTQRPMQELLNGLAQLGATTATMRGDGYAPVIIQGPIHSGTAVISGEDSQPVSALLIASAFVQGPTTIKVRNPGEKPWVAMTLQWFDRLGIPYVNEGFTCYRLKGNARYQGFTYNVPGDLSTAAFPIAAALITQSELTVHNIDMDDPQGDKELISILQRMGGAIDIDAEEKLLCIRRGGPLSGVQVDINDCIDVLPILSVVACFAKGETRITGAAIARQKECNRIGCVASELRKMGGDIEETVDGLVIRGSPLRGALVRSHGDHRMAMSLAVAALGATGQSTIGPVECVAKTYPGFMEDFNKLGANISL